MNLKMWLFVAALVFGFSAAAIAATGVTHSKEVQRLITVAAEKGERELTLTWDGNALGGIEGAKLFETSFNRMYGTKLKVHFTPGPTMTALAAKLTQEVAAGRQPTTDIFLGTVEHYSALVNRNVLEEYEYTRLSPRITKDVVLPRSIGVEIYSNMGGIVYNTNLVGPSEVPRKLEDVLNPKWRGRVASTEHASHFDRVAMRPEWGAERIKAYLTKLSAHIGGFIRVNEIPRIISGEFAMLVLGSSQGVLRATAQGAPVGSVVPDDAAAAHFAHMGVPRNSASPNLAKLFINLVMSEEGQRLLYKTHFSDHHELSGSQSHEFKDLGSRGIKPLRIDVQFMIDHPEMGKIRDDLQKILRQKPKD